MADDKQVLTKEMTLLLQSTRVTSPKAAGKLAGSTLIYTSQQYQENEGGGDNDEYGESSITQIMRNLRACPYRKLDPTGV